jgi:murein DD-endopeptidase MepM/ murein hydrolase activator NlpD
MKPYCRDEERGRTRQYCRITWILFILIILLQLVLPRPVVAEPLLWPLKDTGGVQYTSSGYGIRKSPMGGSTSSFHDGIDLACRRGTPVLASASGVIIVCAIKDPVLGTYMMLRTDSGLDLVYGHLSEGWYKRGQRVQRGWVIGLSGNTGRTTGPHLHFEVRQDPMQLFKEDRIWKGLH